MIRLQFIPTVIVALTCALCQTLCASDAPLALMQKPKVSVWRGAQEKQAAEYVDNGAGGVALHLSWSAESRRLIEVMLPDRPAVESWQAGMKVSLWVRSLPNDGVRAMGLRAADASGEVYQWGARLDAAAQGWQQLTWTLDPARAENVYGGDGNRTFDGAGRWFGLLAITEQEPSEPVHLWISPAAGGEVPAETSSTQASGTDAPSPPATQPAVRVERLESPPVDGTLPLKLVNVAEAGALNVLAGERKNHAISATSAEEGWVQFQWQPGSPPLMEVLMPNRPELLAFEKGVTLSVPINTDDCAGFTKMAIRARDAQGETFQWPMRVEAGVHGWRDVRIDLDPATVETSYGGPEQHRGTIDPPLRLQTLVLLAPGKDGGAVKVGTLTRSSFNPDDISTASRLARIEIDLQRQAGIPLFRADKNEPIGLTLKNAGSVDTEFDLQLTFEHFDQSRSQWSQRGIKLPAGESTQIQATKALSRTGWYLVEAALLSGEQRVEAPPMALMYVTPAGPREHPPQEGFWLGIDARIGNVTRDRWQAELASLIGADHLRVGQTWPRIQRQGPDTFAWNRIDAELELLRQHGLKAVYGLTYTPEWAVLPEHDQQFARRVAEGELKVKPGSASSRPPRPDAWRQFVRAAATRFRGSNVIAYEIWNEPDLSGFYQGTTDQFLELMRIAHQEVKEHHPEAMVLGAGIATLGGHGGHNLNPDLIERSIVEAQHAYDLIAIHQHGTFENFVAGIDGRLAALRQRVDGDKGLFFTETGSHYPGDLTGEGRRQQAHTLVKKVAYGRSRGAVGFNWFALQFGGDYAMVTSGANPVPYPQAAAFNELATMMRGRRFVRQHDLGTGAWVLEFAGAADRLAVVWAEDEAAVGQSVVFSMPANATAKRIDIMGNGSPLPVEGGLAEVKLARDVHYVLLDDATARVAGALAAFDGSAVGEPGREIEISARLFNPTASEASFTLHWAAAGNPPQTQTVAIPGGQERRQAIRITLPPAVKPGEPAPTARLSYELSGTALSGAIEMPMRVAQLIPSEPMDVREPDFVLDRLDATIINVNQADPNRAQYVWSGPRDLSARIWLERTEQGLRMRADVRDDIHVQPHPPAAMWKADSIQLGLQIPGQPGSWEFGLGRTASGDHATTYVRPGGMADAARQFDLRISDIDGGLRYELTMPYAALGLAPERLHEQAIRFNLVVQDDDGGGREGWAQIADGIARGKNPEQFPMIMFAPPR